MKSLLKDETAVSYLLLIGFGLTILVSGIAYNFFSDIADQFMSVVRSANYPLASAMDADGVYGGDMVYVVFRNALIPVLIVVIYFILSMSQKPNKPW